MPSEMHARVVALWKPFVSPGQLCFDVGANMGERTAALRELGARVIAVEPQRDCIEALRARFGDDPQVTIEPVALGATVGTLRLAKVRGYSQVASLSPDWQARGPFSEGFKDAEYEDVSVTTLDLLIAQHGLPHFCKIDVEEFEEQVLTGLSQPIPILSFEYHRAFLDKVRLCITRLESLGPTQFNFAPEESMKLILDSWVSGEELAGQLATIPDDEHGWGDIYARTR